MNEDKPDGGTDWSYTKERYRENVRQALINGQPVPLDTLRTYTLEYLNTLARDYIFTKKGVK